MFKNINLKIVVASFLFFSVVIGMLGVEEIIFAEVSQKFFRITHIFSGTTIANKQGNKFLGSVESIRENIASFCFNPILIEGQLPILAETRRAKYFYVDRSEALVSKDCSKQIVVLDIVNPFGSRNIEVIETSKEFFEDTKDNANRKYTEVFKHIANELPVEKYSFRIDVYDGIFMYADINEGKQDHFIVRLADLEKDLYINFDYGDLTHEQLMNLIQILVSGKNFVPDEIFISRMKEIERNLANFLLDKNGVVPRNLLNALLLHS